MARGELNRQRTTRRQRSNSHLQSIVPAVQGNFPAVQSGRDVPSQPPGHPVAAVAVADPEDVEHVVQPNFRLADLVNVSVQQIDAMPSGASPLYFDCERRTVRSHAL